MLVLSRRSRQAIVIADSIQVTVVAIRGNRVTLGIEAPPQIGIRRSELAPLPKAESGEPPAALQITRR